MQAHDYAPHVAVSVADAFLDQVAPRYPSAAPLFTGDSAEVDWWASTASDTALSLMLVACLKRAAMGQMPMPVNARKRILVAIWNTLGPAERGAFLDFIEPGPAAKA
jgi:hypothetical protein